LLRGLLINQLQIPVHLLHPWPQNNYMSSLCFGYSLTLTSSYLNYTFKIDYQYNHNMDEYRKHTISLND